MGSNVTGWGAGGGGTVLTPAQSTWVQGLIAKLYASGPNVVLAADLEDSADGGHDLGVTGKRFNDILHTGNAGDGT